MNLIHHTPISFINVAEVAVVLSVTAVMPKSGGAEAQHKREKEKDKLCLLTQNNPHLTNNFKDLINKKASGISPPAAHLRRQETKTNNTEQETQRQTEHRSSQDPNSCLYFYYAESH